MSRDRQTQRGAAGVEFALLTCFWVPLLLGTLVIGSRLIRASQTVQVARDAGHMYARGVDFSLTGNQAMVVRLAKELGMAANGANPPGDGVVILSTLTYIGRYQCKALGFADSATPPNPDLSRCINYDHFVFTHRVTIGNPSLRSSSFGAPPASLVNSSGYIANTDYVTKTSLRADAFNLLPKPKEDGSDGFQAGQFAYVVEAYFTAPDFPGFMTGGGTYATALF